MLIFVFGLVLNTQVNLNIVSLLFEGGMEWL